MDEIDWRRERRKQRRLEVLGTNDPTCGLCGNADWRCLELHHIADHGCDDTTAIVCRNCHRGLSDAQKDQPAFDPDADPMLHTIGRFLIGLADMLVAIIERLRSFGAALIERAAIPGDGFHLRTRESFVDDVLFARAWELRARIIGFNLPFDISRLAISHGSARSATDSPAGGVRGGFTFRLSRQKIYPAIQIKHLSRNAATIRFAATMRQKDGRGHRKRGLPTPIRRGHFLDVKTLATALFAKSFTLARLSKFLKVPNPKLEHPNFDGPINAEMIRYAARDVQATWECYAALVERYDSLDLTRTAPENIKSEAGIGKGYLEEMGIAPWRKVLPDVPARLIAKIMGCYYGGRCEVRVRRDIRQVILCDFLSMYPTVCTLMELWRFVIATGYVWRDSTSETRALVEGIDLNALQSPETWTALTTLVRVVPDGDVFPVRAAYEREALPTIGANYLTAATALWFTLADCIASKLFTGKTPNIVEATTFAPGPMQGGLRPINIAGNPEYHVDPAQTDFFKRTIELRQTVKASAARASGDERERLKTEQNALKICANSTAYGIWIEVNVAEQAKPVPLTVFSTTAEPFTFRAKKTEAPGRYFNPLLGTLITGAARLMLAITERLVTNAGLEWVFCDTDSMAIAKPETMHESEFRERVANIVAWFAGLNPYDFAGSILQIEDVNGSLATGEPETLFCLAISSKRYALFNLRPDRQPIMRKISAHGLGQLRAPYKADDAPPELPIPDSSVLREGTERWHCDLWHHIVVATVNGTPDHVRLDYHSALSKPAISRYAATSPELLRWYRPYNLNRAYRDQVKPFGFLLSMTAARQHIGERIVGESKRGRPKKLKPVKPAAAFETDYDKAVANAFDRDTGEQVPVSALKTYAEMLARYHRSPESKFLNGDYDDRGTTLRRHVQMIGTRHIGKESNDWERQAALGLSRVDEIEYGETGSATAPAPGRRHAELSELRDAVARDGLRATARHLGTDATNLRRKVTRVPRERPCAVRLPLSPPNRAG